jgi:hypothetical protein
MQAVLVVGLVLATSAAASGASGVPIDAMIQRVQQQVDTVVKKTQNNVFPASTANV